MERDERVVVGRYREPEEVRATLQRLEREGYAREDISIYTDNANLSQFENATSMDMHTDDSATRRDDSGGSFWDDIKDMFTMDETDETAHHTEDDYLAPYRDDIRNGYTVIAVRNYKGDIGPEMGMADKNRDATDMDMDRDVTDTSRLTEDEKIQLKEERLEVGKEEVQTGEVHVSKETVHDTETVDVPVEHEEVVIERKPVVDGEVDVTDKDFNEDAESYTIPVKEEKVVVDKDTVVTEEVEIKKKRDEDIETVTEDVRREELDVDAKGNVIREDRDRMDDDSTLDDRDLDHRNLDDPDLDIDPRDRNDRI